MAEEENENKRRAMRIEMLFEEEAFSGGCNNGAQKAGSDEYIARAVETEDTEAGRLLSMKTKSQSKV